MKMQKLCLHSGYEKVNYITVLEWALINLIKLLKSFIIFNHKASIFALLAHLMIVLFVVV